MSENNTNNEIEHGPFYWFAFHTWHGTKNFFIRHKLKFFLLLIIFLICAFGFRSFIQPFFITLRLYIFQVLLLLFIGALGYFLAKRSKTLKVPLNIITTLTLIFLCFYGRAIRNYVSLYKAYTHIKQVELDTLPLTDNERIHPQNSIRSLAYEAMSETENPMSPDFVRVGNEYRWTLGIEPAYFIARLTKPLKEIMNISATSPSPDFSAASRVKVGFKTGETLLFSHSATYATIKSFGLYRYLNYEPEKIIYTIDDNGKWVQIVSLIKWVGYIFPRPEFGGVQIIRESDSKSTLKLMLFGAGEWIPPHKIKNYKFLRGQNILPLSVARFKASSFRFQQGFFGPFPGNHKGDIRIPDMPDDANDQPFAGYFKISTDYDKNGSLFQYFGLEPYDSDKQGLSVSLFMPADGSKEVYVYSHYKKKDRSGATTGVSAIPAKVMESKKEFDWVRYKAVENRPYIKNIDGKVRFFWLTTVVTMKENSQKAFISGSVPSIVLTDAYYNRSVWVNPLKQQDWEKQLKDNMEGIWEE